MNEQTQIALTALAQKLGTSAEMLWGVLLRQVPITAAIDAMTALVLGAVFFACLMFTLKKTAPEKGKKYAQLGDEHAFFAWATTIALGGLFLALAFNAASGVIIAVLNPEFAALNHVLKALK